MAIATFIGITLLFFLIRSRPILFHLCSAVLLVGFIAGTGRNLIAGSIGEWTLTVVGLLLYWLGLTIVRVMLTRSVSLRMLADHAVSQTTETVSEEIAGRLKDARYFGLVSMTDEGHRLTAFGSFIAGIVVLCYWILRIK
jgi:hypothetical protein